jgi:hypothetical protein
VVLIIGITGVCRRQELLNLKVNDVEDLGEFMKIMLPITKTKVPHEFTVTKGHFKDLNLVDMVRKYATLGPYGATERTGWIHANRVVGIGGLEVNCCSVWIYGKTV